MRCVRADHNLVRWDAARLRLAHVSPSSRCRSPSPHAGASLTAIAEDNAIAAQCLECLSEELVAVGRRFARLYKRAKGELRLLVQVIGPRQSCRSEEHERSLTWHHGDTAPAKAYRQFLMCLPCLCTPVLRALRRRATFPLRRRLLPVLQR